MVVKCLQMFTNVYKHATNGQNLVKNWQKLVIFKKNIKNFIAQICTKSAQKCTKMHKNEKMCSQKCAILCKNVHKKWQKIGKI